MQQHLSIANHKSVTKKISGMFKRITQGNEKVGVVGGGALNPAIIALLGAKLQTDIRPVDNPQICAAIRAALVCCDQEEPIA